MVRNGLGMLRPGGVVILVGCVTPDTHLHLTGDQLVRGCAGVSVYFLIMFLRRSGAV